MKPETTAMLVGEFYYTAYSQKRTQLIHQNPKLHVDHEWPLITPRMVHPHRHMNEDAADRGQSPPDQGVGVMGTEGGLRKTLSLTDEGNPLVNLLIDPADEIEFADETGLNPDIESDSAHDPHEKS